jgi:hypothetical protein
LSYASSREQLISDYTHRLFPEILKIKDADSHFTKLANLDDFHSAARAGQLPNFTYIQPEWTIGESGTGGGWKSILFHQGHDYHPPGNLDAGENLVKQIYDSLISNRAAWEKTLLIITFDEPIGSFDHYPPPAAIPPWVKGKEPGFKRQYNFNFDRYGGRVPTILVSPLVEKSTVFRSTTSVPFDHTSIIATILKWRGLENKDFGERTKQAPTFDNIVSLSTPRNDEKEVRFLKISHKAGEPVRFYDRFNLRDGAGKYISGFREHAVFPGSFFSEDPTFSEYFPIQAIKNTIEMTPRGILLAGKWRTQDELNKMSAGDIRNTLIVELSKHTNQPVGYFQGKKDDDLVGFGAMVVFLLKTGIRNDTWLKQNTDDDHRNILIYVLAPRPGLQGMSNQELVQIGLEWFAKSNFRFGDKVFIQNKYFDGERLAPDSSHHDYLTTNKSDAYWTIEAISEGRVALRMT